MATELHPTEKTAYGYEPNKRRYRIAAVLIFVIGILFSLAIWQITRQAIDTVERSRFEHYAEMIRALIEERVDDYVAALRGLRAFIDSSEYVTRAEWQTYINDLDIDRSYKGGRGFLYIRNVPRHQLEPFLAEAREDAPDFSVVSKLDRAELYVVKLIEPLEQNRKILGYDLAQKDALYEIMGESARSGKAVLTHATAVVKDGTAEPGVLLLLPVYQKSALANPSGQTWQDLRGWVGASILINGMVADVASYIDSPLDLEILDIIDGQKPVVLYDADGHLHTTNMTSLGAVDSYEMHSTSRVNIINRTWALNVYALPGFSEKVMQNIPEILLIAGVLLSLLCVAQVASYGKTLVHAQKLAEQMTRELRESEERFHKMFQEHHAVMLLIDPETLGIVDANAAACDFYKYSREQLISLPVNKINILPAQDTRNAIRQVKEKSKNHFEFRHTLASGEVKNVEVYTSPIIIDGHPLIFSIIHDITERKIAEQELAQHRKNLETLVEEKTDKLKAAHAELLQQDRLATLGKLTATVSHELRNPLGTIKTALFSVEDSINRKDVDKVLRPLELAERSIDRCVAIIEELNSFARVKQLNIKETALDDWLQETVDEQNIPAGILCEMHLAAGEKVPFDQEKLRQVVVNLIGNALHALQEKSEVGGLLKISTRLLENQVEISIGDNGIGMTKETKKKIFEPFFSTKGFGVGLGMVVVKNIVEQHQGEVIIESRKGAGTTVMVRLPRAKTG